MSKECLEKVTQTISFLAQPRESHLLLLTGEMQRDRIAELLGLRACNFRPRHSSKLGNEFRVFTNYDPEERLGSYSKTRNTDGRSHTNFSYVLFILVLILNFYFSFNIYDNLSFNFWILIVLLNNIFLFILKSIFKVQI
ncbi:hypothetical protein ES332_D02G125200v1 [Gossypium tomentosum]|uniref:Uncharacterized protein n=1 Tax=Gossypium tomentosum TaxID=34277 RepID=A0A5D2LWA2_GOSTO|nr:hypothetical protein ES332_D02G125200v1 [Gossypium tomentosum]